MGKHTLYWQQYQKVQVRGVLKMLVAIIGWIVGGILIVFAQPVLGSFFPVAMGAVFLGLIVSLVALGKDAYKVVCPECGSTYKRSKWHGRCPSCGLALLQDEL